jgi:hypothetical protein
MFANNANNANGALALGLQPCSRPNRAVRR